MKFTFAPESTPLAGYTIKRAIHRGGFGEVYYALSDAGKEVALKLLQHNLEVELRGIQQCLNLKHANLVSIFDVRTDDDGDHWIVMEYVSGKNLAAVIDAAAGPLPIEETRKWLDGMARGLAFLHDRGIVHRDLKPANVFEEAGVVKIGDVGLSKFISESRRSAQTQSVGTVYYMAPEVAHGRYGREVDVYSLGIVLYEMLTGHVPFDGESTAEILMKHLTELPDLSPLPAAVQPVIARALEKDPLKRTSTVTQLAADFDRAMRGFEVATEIPDESFAGRAPRTPTVREVVHSYKHKAKQLRREAKKAAHAAAVAARHEAKAAYKRRRARVYADRAAQLAGNGHAPVSAGNGSVPARPQRQSRGSSIAQVVKIAAVALVLMALFAPSTALASLKLVFVGGIFATLAYGTFRIFGLVAAPFPVAAAAARQGGNAPHVTHYHHKLTPDTLRIIPLRYRLADLSGTMTYAVLVAGLVTAGIWGVMPGLFNHGDPGSVGLFGLVTLLATWGVLVPAKLLEGTRTPPHLRRLLLAGVGALVGGGAFWLHQNLLVNTPYAFWGDRHSAFALFDHIGARSLTGADYQPSLAGYMIFFAALFGVRRWWRHADTLRKRRLRVGSLLLTALAGLVLPTIFAFPPTWGLMWAVAISTVVQVSSAWVPREERQQLLEGRFDV